MRQQGTAISGRPDHPVISRPGGVTESRMNVLFRKIGVVRDDLGFRRPVRQHGNNIGDAHACAPNTRPAATDLGIGDHARKKGLVELASVSGVAPRLSRNNADPRVTSRGTTPSGERFPQLIHQDLTKPAGRIEGREPLSERLFCLAAVRTLSGGLEILFCRIVRIADKFARSEYPNTILVQGVPSMNLAKALLKRRTCGKLRGKPLNILNYFSRIRNGLSHIAAKEGYLGGR